MMCRRVMYVSSFPFPFHVRRDTHDTNVELPTVSVVIMDSFFLLFVCLCHSGRDSRSTSFRRVDTDFYIISFDDAILGMGVHMLATARCIHTYHKRINV